MGKDNVLNQDINDADDQKSDSSVRLMDDLMSTIAKNATKPAVSEVTDLGQISKMNLPTGWEEGVQQQHRQHAASYQEFHPVGEPECQLGFYYRGRRTSELAGQRFRDLLNKPPHALSRDEIDSLKEIVRDKYSPADFQCSNARTVDIGGKRVLLLEGRYKAIQQDSKHLFIDSDGTGTAVQEIFFQAPKDKFANYAKVAEQSMKSIKWK